MRIGILTDVHEDLERLRLAFAILDERGCDELVCLGDSVGFSVPYFAHFATRDAAAVLSLLRRRCAVVLAGNHDLFAARTLPAHRAGVEYPEDWYALPYAERERLLRGRVWLYEREELSPLLGPEDLAYLRSLPELAVRRYGQMGVLFSHWAYPDLPGATVHQATTPGDAAAHLELMARHGCALGISGHGHFEGIRAITVQAVIDHPFGPVPLGATPTWLHGPAVANGTYANGVMILDTNERVVEAVPLGSPVHALPAWRSPWSG